MQRERGDGDAGIHFQPCARDGRDDPPVAGGEHVDRIFLAGQELLHEQMPIARKRGAAARPRDDFDAPRTAARPRLDDQRKLPAVRRERPIERGVASDRHGASARAKQRQLVETDASASQPMRAGRARPPTRKRLRACATPSSSESTVGTSTSIAWRRQRSRRWATKCGSAPASSRWRCAAGTR